MNKRIGVIAVLACMFSLCLVLAACGGAGVDKSKFLGTWGLVGSSEESLNEESIEMMKSLNLEVTLTLNEDETGNLNLFGENTAITWKATNASEGTVSMDGVGDANLKFDGDKLVMEDSTSSMTFQKQ